MISLQIGGNEMPYMDEWEYRIYLMMKGPTEDEEPPENDQTDYTEEDD